MTTLTQERLTEEAKQRLEQYLRQVRIAVGGCRSLSPDEVERDIREHIDSELPAEHDPVSLHELDSILARLGSPSQWVPQEEMPWWRRFVIRWRTGPEDWRLAYLAFGLLVAGVLLPLLDKVLFPVLWVFVSASYLASRASLAAARGRNEDVGAQRWFIYPTLLIVNTCLLVLVLVVPPFLGGVGVGNAMSEYLSRGAAGHPPDFRDQREFMVAVTAAAFPIWWILVGTTLAIWPRPVQVVLAGPYGEGFRRKHAKALIYTGLGLGILWALAAALLLWRAA